MTTFSELFQSHSRDVYRFALFLSGDHDLAEDIVSETFIRVWHARERVDLSTVKAYLLAIARNLYLDQRRRAARHTALVDDRVDPRPGPEQLASARSELQALLAELQTLPEIDRAAVLLRAEEGLSYDEIGALLGLTAIAARVRLPPTPPVPATAERQALAKTRELMKTRTATLVTAVVFTVLPFTFTFSGGRITFVLFRDAPVIAAAWWFTAAVLWGWHIWVRRRLAVSGI